MGGVPSLNRETENQSQLYRQAGLQVGQGLGQRQYQGAEESVGTLLIATSLFLFFGGLLVSID